MFDSNNYDLQREALLMQQQFYEDQIALQNEKANWQRLQAEKAAQQAIYNYNRQLQTAVNQVNIQVQSYKDLQKLSDDIAQKNSFAYLMNAQSITEAALKDYAAGSKQINRAMGDIEARAAVGGILVSSASVQDSQKFVKSEMTDALQNNYADKINQANQYLSKSNETLAQNYYEQASTNAKIVMAQNSLNNL